MFVDLENFQGHVYTCTQRDDLVLVSETWYFMFIINLSRLFQSLRGSGTGSQEAWSPKDTIFKNQWHFGPRSEALWMIKIILLGLPNPVDGPIPILNFEMNNSTHRYRYHWWMIFQKDLFTTPLEYFAVCLPLHVKRCFNGY